MSDDAHEHAVDSRQLAAILGVSYGQVRSMALSGAIPGFQVGTRWRFFPSKVVAHLEGVKKRDEEDIFRQPPGSFRRRGHAHPNF